MPKHLAQVNSTVPNMERYGHKCQIKQIIFYSTFSLSSQYFIQLFLSLLTNLSLSNPCSLSLSSSNQITSPSLIPSPLPIKPLPLPLVWRLHCCWFEAAIIISLKPPLPPRSEAAMLPQSEPISAMLKATTPLVWCVSQPWREANLSHHCQSKTTTTDKESYHC